MATRRFSILGPQTVPDGSGEVYQEPADINFGSNDLYPHLVFVFENGSTRIGLRGVFMVPSNYVDTAVVKVYWGTTGTTGDVEWDFDYRAVAAGEPLDPSTDQESVNLNDTAEGTARDLAVTSLTVTDGNFAAGDLVLFELFRDGVDAGDTLAASAYVFDVVFEYADA